MASTDAAIVAFASFGVATQALLLCFFAARRWSPGIAARFGWVVYAFGGLGLPLGVWLILNGQSWRLFVGPMVTALWALLGAFVDVWRPRQWRSPPAWGVFVPYLVLYFWAQMFMWWPLWDASRAAWWLFLVLFVPNTVLNIRGHVGDQAGE